MAGKHASLPLYGVQYHPESICSAQGDVLVRNFNQIAAHYNHQMRPGLAAAQASADLAKINLRMVSSHSVHDQGLVPGDSLVCNGAPDLCVKPFTPQHHNTTPIDLCDYFARSGVDFTFLNSAADPGQWCVIGLPIPGHSEVIKHSVDSHIPSPP
ncbi:hypothetical protein JCM33374_g4041 [Metschnikowia sp. JCM 33374]|nr:hypothetical protein JCM33374_g4041 [Metschnikowia sp. JCM 33374]